MDVSVFAHEVGEPVHGALAVGPAPPESIAFGADWTQVDASVRADLIPNGRSIDGAVLALVALGVFLRIGRYLTNYPIWGDEAYLALNFVRRGYVDLLSPLEYGQICPILFLWAELTSVKIFGFSELSLRLCPLLCGVGSVFLFRRVASRLFDGPALVLAMAIFAISVHPIRHSADAKPYASDLLVALGLLALAIESWRSSERTRWLWMLVGFTPIALAASYPAAFVEGGIGLALVPSVLRTQRRGPKIALAAYFLTAAVSFAFLYVGYMHRQQSGVSLPELRTYWSESFPPVDSPVRLASWLIATHAGSMFAYPGGGNRGASGATLLLVLIAAVVLWRRGQRTSLALLVMPMGIGILAAALRLYPYGGEARIMQYAAPAVCLMSGLGLSTLLGRIRRPAGRAMAIRAATIAFGVTGVVMLADDFRHPYRAIYDYQVREFARRFWPEQAKGAELACLRWDFGVKQGRVAYSRTAIYLCNQQIYSPQQSRGGGPRWELVTPQRPLRCVAFEIPLKSPEVSAWLASMVERYTLRKQSDVVVPTTGLNMKPWDDQITIFEFLPKSHRPIEQVANGAVDHQLAK